MRRGLWFVAGTAAGVYASARARRVAEEFTVDGLHDRLTGWFAGARVLTDELRAGMAAKETDLRARVAQLPAGPTEEEQDAPVQPLPGGRHLELTRKGDD